MTSLLQLLSLAILTVAIHSKDLIARLKNGRQHDAAVHNLIALQLDRMEFELNALRTQHRGWSTPRHHMYPNIPVSAAFDMKSDSLTSKRSGRSKKAVSCLMLLWFSSTISGQSVDAAGIGRGLLKQAKPADADKPPAVLQKLKSLFQNEGQNCAIDGTQGLESSTNLAQRVPAAVNKAVIDIMEVAPDLNVDTAKIGGMLKKKASEIWASSEPLVKDKLQSGQQYAKKQLANGQEYTKKQLANAAGEISKEMNELPMGKVGDILADNIGERAVETFKVQWKLTGKLLGELGSLAGEHVQNRKEARQQEKAQKNLKKSGN
eukprot:CAMPEP_0202697964 /NCGR_PEP_ID=MMETSP1385-20130828/11250_1 /ASSEMBLY_ACC=CAM_ASM_000861 /TAXON_ID=933848 /ORGANISM="Elphidium margaritaceum" /LENGTH=319 /DNA_ID=CAMNT_0049354551 /DNA_START=100 /DNA_END=1059 /DNA_ORIENTATION=-